MLMHTLDGSTTIAVRKGEPFAVATMENASTGYLWSVATEGGVEHLGTEYEDDDVDVVGVGGSRRRLDHFTCPTIGTGAITMREARPWMGADADAVVATVTVTCDADPSIA